MHTMKPTMHTCELLSALVDGQLAGDDLTTALQACQQGESALTSWNTYHLIGEVLRSPATQVHAADLAFVARLNLRLAQEAPGAAAIAPAIAPVVVAEVGAAAQAAPKSVSQVLHHRGQASNDGNFRWKLVAGLASLAAVTAVGWNAAGLLAPAAGPQLALASSPTQQVVVASPQGPMVRDARLEELLAAHKQLGGASALQLPAGFLRNATFEAPQNAGR